VTTVSADVMWSGRLFQISGLATLNAQPPTVNSHTSRSFDLAVNYDTLDLTTVISTITLLPLIAVAAATATATTTTMLSPSAALGHCTSLLAVVLVH